MLPALTLALFLFTLDASPRPEGAAAGAAVPAFGGHGLVSRAGQDADLPKRLQAVADRACDLDPLIRAEAAAEAVRIHSEHESVLAGMVRARKVPALIVSLLAGKHDASDLLRLPDRAARLAACDRITPTKDQLPDVLRQIDAKDPGVRIAAALALGRVDDPALRRAISTTLGHGMRRAGDVDILFALISSWWSGNVSTRLVQIHDSDPARAALSLAALCNVPSLAVSEGFGPAFLRALENEKIDRAARSLLIRVLGRRAPASLCALLSVRDRKVRFEVVEALDRGLVDPLTAPAVYAARSTKLDDGGDPGQPLVQRIDGWLRRLCGEGVTSQNFPAWLRTSYRSQVERRADAAVAKGAAGLLKRCESADSWKSSPGGLAGLSAFAAYALLKSDVAPDDPGLARRLDAVLDRDPQGLYATSLAALALSAAVEKGSPRRERLERRLQGTADLLVASQLKSGGWSYPVRSALDPASSGWSDDLSNTQFAILGLRAAANAGARIPRATWERALLLLEKTQLEDGGWSYSGTDQPAYPRMTAAGASSWIICKISLDEKLTPAAAADTFRVRNAMRWLDHGAFGSPMSTLPDFYLLYSLERLCMISGIDRLGSVDWYAEGAALLARTQGADGLWRGQHGAVPDTCMALLFLRKAFVARPDIPTETARRRATPEQALDVYERRVESLFGEGVKEIRVDRDGGTSFLLVVVESGADAARLAETLGREIDGVPLRIEVRE